MADDTGTALPAGSTGTGIAPLRPELLGAYKLMLQYQFVGALGLIAILAVILLAAFAATSTWTPPLLILVTMIGTLGAFFSALTRLYNVDQLSVALISPTISQLGGRYLFDVLADAADHRRYRCRRDLCDFCSRNGGRWRHHTYNGLHGR